MGCGSGAKPPSQAGSGEGSGTDTPGDDGPGDDRSATFEPPKLATPDPNANDPKPEVTGEAPKDGTLGDMVEPIKVPTLEELNEQVEWLDQPVVDSLKQLQQQLLAEKPLATVQQALKLRNSPKTNMQIRSALGRPPESDGDVDWDATINRQASADLKSSNPIMISSTVEFDVAGLTNFGLFSFDDQFNPFAATDSVVSWQTSSGLMFDKVVLRDDLVWSDGKPITAHDVEFSFQAIMTSTVPVPAVRSGTDKLAYVKAYDDHTVVFFHRRPLATNVWNVNFPIIPKHIYAESILEDPTLQNSPYHVEQESNPVCGGPYKITKRSRGQEIVLTRREDYYMYEGEQVRGKPYFKEVRMRIITEPSVALLALKKGDIDEMALNAELWDTQSDDDEFYANCTKAYDTEWVYFYFGWNCKEPYFTDARVRQAMSHAFNHEAMLEEALFNLYEPSVGIFHPDSYWAPKPSPSPFVQDLDKAEELLDAAGWKDTDNDGVRDKVVDGKSVRFEFTILMTNDPVRIAICNLLRQDLDQIGVVCNLRPLEFTVMQEKCRNHEFHAILAGWGTGTDPSTSENLWRTDAGRNYGQYSNPKVDKLFDEGEVELDPEKRRKIYQNIATTLWDDQPYTWLYVRNSFYGFSKDLRGYHFSPRGPYNYGPGFSAIWKPAAN